MRLPLGYVKMGIGQVRRAIWIVRVSIRSLVAPASFQAHLVKLSVERFAGGRELRAVSSAGWYFPIYSYTFVYQELTQLIHAGFRLKFFYGALASDVELPAQFRPLSDARVKLVVDPLACALSLRYFERRMPDRVDQLLAALSDASGLSRDELVGHEHVRQAFAFARQVRAYRPAYLHSHFFYQDTLYALVASWLLEIPRGVSCYADHMLADYPLKVVALHLRQATVVVATSRRIEQELRTIEPALPADRIVVKPNAINTVHFPAIRREAPGPGAPVVLATLCRIEPKKGLLDLVDAMRRLLDDGHRVEWWLGGDVDKNPSSRDYRDQLVARIADRNLTGAVRLLGRRTERQINSDFERAHVFVAPFIETDSGDKDGVPTALLEAMASGLPVVATDAGSIPEVVESGSTGLLVPQGDSVALAAAIARLIGDPVLRETLGRQGAAFVRQRFDVGICEAVLHERLFRFLTAAEPVAPLDRRVTP